MKSTKLSESDSIFIGGIILTVIFYFLAMNGPFLQNEGYYLEVRVYGLIALIANFAWQHESGSLERKHDSKAHKVKKVIFWGYKVFCTGVLFGVLFLPVLNEVKLIEATLSINSTLAGVVILATFATCVMLVIKAVSSDGIDY